MTGPARITAALVYDRVAAVYDLYAAPMEVLGGQRARYRLFGRAWGRVLELGVGTGLNLASYPCAELTGIDISPRMLARVRRRADRLGLNARLEVADIGTAIIYAVVFAGLLALSYYTGPSRCTADYYLERRYSWWWRLAELRRPAPALATAAVPDGAPAGTAYTTAPKQPHAA
jgi:SAM-dependent methyltransferase